MAMHVWTNDKAFRQTVWIRFQFGERSTRFVVKPEDSQQCIFDYF